MNILAKPVLIQVFDMKAKFFIIFLVFLACASQKRVIEQGDALSLISDFTRETRSKNFVLTEQKVDEIVARLDSLCNNQITVAPLSDFDKLEQRISAASQFDEILLDHAQQTNNHRLAVSAREFKFRTLVKTQEQMNQLFENEDTPSTSNLPVDSLASDEDRKIARGEAHGKWVFKQRVSLMLPFIQLNEKVSTEKSRLLLEMIDLLPGVKDQDEKWRAWLAIDRMLAEIDVQKSESGYKPFQRGASGIFIQPGVIIEKLRTLHEQETDGELKAFSRAIFSKLEKNLNAEKTGDFWQRVEFSKELQHRIDSGGLDQQDARTEELYAMRLAAYDWFNKGYISSDNKLKVDYYTRAIEFDTSYVSAYNNRGNAYQALGIRDSALADYDRAVSLDSLFAPAYINRGNILQEFGRHDEAVQDFSRAIKLEPGYTLAFNNRGKSYKELGMYGKARQDFNRVIQLEPKFASAYFHRGDVHRRMGNDPDAIADYTIAIDFDPTNTIAYNNRGMSNNNLKRYQQAILDYKKAIEISPDYAAAYYNLGIVYWTLSKWKDVVIVWEKSLELNPDQSYIIEYLPKARSQARKMR